MSWSPKLFSPFPFVCAPHSPRLLQRLPFLPHEGDNDILCEARVWLCLSVCRV